MVNPAVHSSAILGCGQPRFIICKWRRINLSIATMPVYYSLQASMATVAVKPNKSTLAGPTNGISSHTGANPPPPRSMSLTIVFVNFPKLPPDYCQKWFLDGKRRNYITRVWFYSGSRSKSLFAMIIGNDGGKRRAAADDNAGKLSPDLSHSRASYNADWCQVESSWQGPVTPTRYYQNGRHHSTPSPDGFVHMATTLPCHRPVGPLPN